MKCVKLWRVVWQLDEIWLLESGTFMAHSVVDAVCNLSVVCVLCLVWLLIMQECRVNVVLVAVEGVDMEEAMEVVMEEDSAVVVDMIGIVQFVCVYLSVYMKLICM